MAISFDESDDYYSIADHASLTLPHSDWCVGIWTKVDDNTGPDFQYILSNNNYAVNNSFNLMLKECAPFSWLAVFVDGDGTKWEDDSGSSPAADGKWRLIIVQRRTADSELQTWFCEPGQSATKEASVADALYGASDGGLWNIGRRVDGNSTRYYGSLAAEFFKGNFSLSAEEITALGAGIPIYLLGHPLDIYLPMRTAEATLKDLVESNDATRQDVPVTVEHAPVILGTGPTLIWHSLNQVPTAPTSLLCEEATNPLNIIDITPEFSAILNDPNPGDTLTHIKIEVDDDDEFGSPIWQPDWIDITDITEGNRCEDVSYAGSALTAGVKYYWRIKAKDDDGAEGAWSDSEIALTLQPDATNGLDNFLNSGSPTANYGTEITLYIGHQIAYTYRTLIRFNLTDLPSDAIITSTVLSLYCKSDFSANARTFRVFRQKRAWVESECTWNIYSTGNNWQAAGGFGANDCEQTDIGSRNFTATETVQEFKDFNLTPTTKAGLDLGNGWLIKADTEDEDCYVFYSSDEAVAAKRPKLVIVYTTPLVYFRIKPTEERNQTIKVTQAKQDLQGYLDQPSQTVKIIQAKSDLQFYLDECTQTMLIGQTRSDLQFYLTEVCTQTLLIAQSHSDMGKYLENVGQSLKIIQTHADLQAYKDSLAQTIKIAQAKSDLHTYLTEARNQTLLIAQVKSDIQTYLIEQREQTLLIVQSRIDALRYIESVTQTLLIAQTRQELQSYLDERIQTILISQARSDLQTYNTEQLNQLIKIIQSLYWRHFIPVNYFKWGTNKYGNPSQEDYGRMWY